MQRRLPSTHRTTKLLTPKMRDVPQCSTTNAEHTVKPKCQHPTCQTFCDVQQQMLNIDQKTKRTRTRTQRSENKQVCRRTADLVFYFCCLMMLLFLAILRALLLLPNPGDALWMCWLLLPHVGTTYRPLCVRIVFVFVCEFGGGCYFSSCLVRYPSNVGYVSHFKCGEFAFLVRSESSSIAECLAVLVLQCVRHLLLNNSERLACWVRVI